jgi:hypothetical protein
VVALLLVLIAVTKPAVSALATYTVLSSGNTISFTGAAPTAMVASTVRPTILTSETVPSRPLATYARGAGSNGSLVMAMPSGCRPTVRSMPKTMLVVVLMNVTELELRFATSRIEPSGVTASPTGLAPTVIGNPTTVFVVVSMTVTAFAMRRATYRRFNTGLTATASGASATGMVAMTWAVVVLMTLTESEPVLAT